MPTLIPIARAGVLAGSVVLFAPVVHAAPPTKEECVDAHAKGQDAREGGKLSQAGKLFLLCADAACPELVRNDCARFADETERLQPTVTFVARDGAGRDLVDTQVHVDGALVAPRLGDGKAYDIDPGPHTVRFVHAGQETVVEVVVSQGEKGRALVGTFASAAAQGPGAAPSPAAALVRPAAPLILVGLGATAAVAGGVVLGVGLARIPSNCSLATHQCAAPPHDPVFDRAASAVTLVNLGTVVGGVGVLTLGGSLIGYFVQPLRPAKTAALVPWVGPGVAGLALRGSL